MGHYCANSRFILWAESKNVDFAAGSRSEVPISRQAISWHRSRVVALVHVPEIFVGNFMAFLSKIRWSSCLDIC